MPESEEKESGERAEKKIRPRRVSEEEQARKERVKVRCFFSSDQAHYIYPSTPPSSGSTERRQALFHCRFFLLPHEFSGPVARVAQSPGAGLLRCRSGMGAVSSQKDAKKRLPPRRRVSSQRDTAAEHLGGCSSVTALALAAALSRHPRGSPHPRCSHSVFQFSTEEPGSIRRFFIFHALL